MDRVGSVPSGLLVSSLSPVQLRRGAPCSPGAALVSSACPHLRDCIPDSPQAAVPGRCGWDPGQPLLCRASLQRARLPVSIPQAPLFLSGIWRGDIRRSSHRTAASSHLTSSRGQPAWPGGSWLPSSVALPGPLSWAPHPATLQVSTIFPQRCVGGCPFHTGCPAAPAQ